MIRKTFLCFMIALLAGAAAFAQTVDDLAIVVSKDQNREYSFTDKQAAFWYGRTHQDTPVDWFAGWNIAKKRVLSDYALYVDGRQLRREAAQSVIVKPHCLSRIWENAEETLFMVDHRQVLYIRVAAPGARKLALSLLFPEEADPALIQVYSAKGKRLSLKDGLYTADAASEGFILAYGPGKEAAKAARDFVKNREKLLRERRERMNGILSVSNPLKTNLPDLDLSLAWLTLTMDQLVTEQQGKGIYAGLPWFNEYWGRDMFIAMPGATLVTGQFDYTKDILKDFSRFQDTDTLSATCGRIPNRANLEGILYNTADGTPRYVIEAYELLQYCGDGSFLRDIYPSIVLSTEQSLRHHTDAKGYLLHEDADTWMDVKRNGIPGSPRGNRANDIQYLWFKQLTCAAALARMMEDPAHAEEWESAAARLASHFQMDFCNQEAAQIYDHLDADGLPDLQFRPNQLFCFDLVSDNLFKQRVTRRCWEELVYPWGVASLAQTDPQFHPQHENWHYYHKDDAYHNGTVWLWVNGIAMQRMIEYGQKEMAWRLFQNMNRQALKEGAVGSLAENADAHPREGKAWANRSGTFLQAWSNSEQLRVWYQCFLGIQPDLINHRIVVEPHLPAEITDLETSELIGGGKIVYKFHDGRFDIGLEDLPGVQLILRTESAQDLEKAQGNPVFQGLDFCTPRPLDHYPCFDHYYEESLTY